MSETPASEHRGTPPESGLIFPELRSEKDIDSLGVEGVRVVHEVFPRLSPEKYRSGYFILLLGYLKRLYGGLENLKGKTVVDIGGGTISGESFKAGLAQILRLYGAKVIIIDPVARSEDFIEFGDSIRVFSKNVEECVEENCLGGLQADLVVSSAVINSPNWKDKIFKGAKESVLVRDFLESSARIAPLQIHLVPDDVHLATTSSDVIGSADVNIRYNLGVNRKNEREQYSMSSDFIVVDNRNVG